MTTVLLGATVLCVVAHAGVAMADLAKAKFVLANSAEVGVQPTALPFLATAKLAGAFGLLVGLAGFPRLGLAAGVGLIVFFVGALAAHLRAHVLYNIAFPGLYLALAVAATTYFAASP